MADDAVALAAVVIPAGEERGLSAELVWVFRDVLSDHVWLRVRAEADLLNDDARYDADLSVEAIQPAESGLDIGLKRLREAGDGQQEREDGEEANHWFRYPRIVSSMPRPKRTQKEQCRGEKSQAFSARPGVDN